MKHFKDKVAVITGAANGIGRGLAERCAQEGMKIVLADIDEKALSATCQGLRNRGAKTTEIVTDVSKADEVEELAKKSFESYGAIHLLCNNAGIGSVSDIYKSLWESDFVDWEEIIGVNLWGVIYGIRSFVPIMLKQHTECHIVNTASSAGLTAGAGLGIYKVTKHGVVTLSETLYQQLRQRQAPIGVSVLCPDAVSTRVVDAALEKPSGRKKRNLEEEQQVEAFLQRVNAGMSPNEVADQVFQAIREDKLYILTHSEIKDAVRTRMENILDEHNP